MHIEGLENKHVKYMLLTHDKRVQMTNNQYVIYTLLSLAGSMFLITFVLWTLNNADNKAKVLDVFFIIQRRCNYTMHDASIIMLHVLFSCSPECLFLSIYTAWKGKWGTLHGLELAHFYLAEAIRPHLSMEHQLLEHCGCPHLDHNWSTYAA